MSNTTETVMKINDCYVSNDCVQIACPYNDCITILNKHGILYHHKTNSNLFINKYLDDFRRPNFPFYQIPTFYAKNEYGYLNCYTNQIFNYNQPYIIIKDSQIIENYIVKENGEALLISKQLSSYKKSNKKSRKEVEELINPNSSIIRSNIHYIYLTGAFPEEGIFTIKDEDTIIDYAKESIKENLIDLKEYIRKHPSSNVGDFFTKNPLFLNFVEKNLNTENVEKMELNIPLIDNRMAIIAKTNGENIELSGLEITFIKKDNYLVTDYTIPINQYTYEQIKFLAKKIAQSGHPNIQLKHNPGVSKQDLENAKKMIYEKRKK